ncbi:CDP-glycerol glycerophosphotransferase family protein [Pediococcus acidilactici]
MKREFVRGKLSVIVPCYKVEDYIKECLDSLANQTYKDIEVIMVDDGSPDNTGEILDVYGNKYPNFTAVHTPNGGLSAARNAGLDYVTGEFLAFVDSDDVVPKNAYEKLVGSLLQTGSDLASGFVNRFNSKKVYPSVLHEKAIPETSLKTNINVNTNLVYDTTAWNKVYKTEIFIGNGLKYPEGLTYEDIPVSMRYHLLAKTVDVIAEDTYHWRVREGANQSITQQRANFQLFWDRMQTLEMARRSILELGGSPELKEAFNFKVLDMDIPLYLNGFQNASEETLFRFQRDLVKFLRNYDLSVIKELSVRKQIQYYALLNGDFSDFKRYGYQYKKIGQIINERGQYRYENKALRPELKEKIVLESGAIEGKARVTRLYWENNQAIVEGRYFISQIAKFEKSNFKFSAHIRNTRNYQSTSIEAIAKKKTKRRRIFWGTTYYSFKLAIDVKDVLSQIGAGRWVIDLIATDLNLTITTPVGSPIKRRNALLDSKRIVNGIEEHIINNDFDRAWKLFFDVQAKMQDQAVVGSLPLVKDFTLTDKNDLTFEFLTDKKLMDPLFIFGYGKDERYPSRADLIQEEQDYCKYRVSFNFNNLENGITNGRLYLYNAANMGRYQFRFSLDEQVITLTNSSCKARIDISSLLKGIQIIFEKNSAAVESYTLANGVLHVVFSVNSRLMSNATDKVQFLMIRTDAKESYDTFEVNRLTNNRFEVNIKYSNGKYPLFKSGYYNFFADIDNGRDSIRIPILMGGYQSRKVLKINKFKNLKLKLQVNAVERFQMGLFQQWDWIDNSVRKRKAAYYIAYPLMRLLPLNSKTVVLESFWGRSFDDNPRAIYEYWQKAHPEYKFIWPVTDLSTKVSGRGKVIRRGSFKYWYYLATAKYFIQNTNFPNSYVKRRGQVEVETLHGTFMKKMGLEEPSMRNSTAKGQRNFMKRNRRWDYLISPSAYMDRVGANAFDFKNDVLSVGFPRNDELINNNNPEFIKKLKLNIGIPLDKKVVLYAPTYRQAGKLDFELDLKSMQDKLADDYVVLVRLHHLVANAIDIHEFEGFAYDLSSYPNIADLYLIADVLITDYSSVMFDYGYLKRPMIFFAYDLDWYLDDSNRGVYLDYVKTVPGPIAQSTEQIIQYLQKPDKLEVEYGSKLEWFYNEFCTYGRDGDASKNTVEQVINSKITRDNGEKGFFTSKLAHALGVTSLEMGALNLLGRFLKRSKLIIFESNGGRATDSDPRALYEYLKNHPNGYKLMWLASADQIGRFRSAALPYVIKKSLKGIIARARASFYITNSEVAVNWKKPRGMKVIQTGNGNPLKKVGTDLSSDFIPGQSIYQYQKSQVIEGRKWDYLLTGNATAADLQKNAFRLGDNQIVMSGLPRIDQLLDMNSTKREKIRQELGITATKRVILYEPTWRDDEIVYVDQYGMKSKVDFENLSYSLPKDVVVLVKFHPLITSGRPEFENLSNIIDVSDWQSNVELLAVADLLITDYSSVLFDFAVTNKPMIFMVPDLEEYQDYVRGLYVDDYEAFVPGPVVKSTNELVEAINSWTNADPKWQNYQRKVVAFNQEYNSWNDGRSAQKAMSYVFNHSRYSVEKISNPVESINLKDATLLWSGVYGQKDTQFLGNFDLDQANTATFKVLETRVLKDPINKTLVGAKFFKIKIADEFVWVSEHSAE